MTTTMHYPLPIPAVVEAAVALSVRAGKPVRMFPEITVRLLADRETPFARFARRVEACGGTWARITGNAATRDVTLPLPLTVEAETLLLDLVATYASTACPTELWMAGQNVYQHCKTILTAEKVLRITARWEGLARGSWQARREAEYDADQKAKAARLGRLLAAHERLLAELAALAVEIDAERARRARHTSAA